MMALYQTTDPNATTKPKNFAAGREPPIAPPAFLAAEGKEARHERKRKHPPHPL